MGTIKRLEEIKARKTGRQLANVIYDLSDAVVFAKDFGLGDQMRRSAISRMSNSAEGFDRA